MEYRSVIKVIRGKARRKHELTQCTLLINITLLSANIFTVNELHIANFPKQNGTSLQTTSTKSGRNQTTFRHLMHTIHIVPEFLFCF